MATIAYRSRVKTARGPIWKEIKMLNLYLYKYSHIKQMLIIIKKTTFTEDFNMPVIYMLYTELI